MHIVIDIKKVLEKNKRKSFKVANNTEKVGEQF